MESNEHSLINFHDILTNLFSKAIKTAYPNLGVIIQPAISASSKFSDYQCNASMQICKLLKTKGKVNYYFTKHNKYLGNI